MYVESQPSGSTTLVNVSTLALVGYYDNKPAPMNGRLDILL